MLVVLYTTSILLQRRFPVVPEAHIIEAMELVRRQALHRLVLDDNKRIDGRAFDELQPIHIEVRMDKGFKCSSNSFPPT